MWVDLAFFGMIVLLLSLAARDVRRQRHAERHANELLARRAGGSSSPSR